MSVIHLSEAQLIEIERRARWLYLGSLTEDGEILSRAGVEVSEDVDRLLEFIRTWAVYE